MHADYTFYQKILRITFNIKGRIINCLICLSSNDLTFETYDKLCRFILILFVVLKQVMINIEIPEKAMKIIGSTITIVRKNCEYFVSFIFQNTKSSQFDYALTFIEKVLLDFAEHVSKNCFQSMAASALNAISTLNSDHLQKVSQMQESVNRGINALEIYSDSYKVNSMFLDNFEKKVKLQEQSFDNSQRKIIDEKTEMKIYLQQILCQLQKQEGKQIEQFIVNLSKDVFQPIRINQTSQPYISKQMSILNPEIKLKIKKKISLKNKKQARQNLRIQELRISKKQRFQGIKKLHYKRILRMKHKYRDFQKKLFKEQRQYLWFFNTTDEQIENKVMNCNKSTLNQLKKTFRQWRKQLEKRICIEDQICIKHKNKIYYLCLNELLKDKIYLCNQCVSGKDQIIQHYNHQIICEKHRKSINYKFISPKQQTYFLSQQNDQQQEQIFLCKQCLLYTTKRYDLICCDHYQQITQICFQQNCIKEDIYKICSICETLSNKHQNHRIITWSQELLMEELRLSNNVDIQRYQPELIKAQNMLKLNPLQKMRISYAERVWPTIRFLESFAVYSIDEVHKWIRHFMAEGKKEDLMLLKELAKIKETNTTEMDLWNYLQIFNNFLSRELQQMFSYVWKRIEICCETINKGKNISKETVTAQLNKKYAQIINIQLQDMIDISPMSLNDVDPAHYTRIQKIVIIKQNQKERDERLNREWRDRRSQFYKRQIRIKLQQKQIPEIERQQIIKLFIEAQYTYQNKFKIDQSKLQNLLHYKDTIRDLYQTYTKINDSHFTKLNECSPWQKIQNNQFTNLKAINIWYPSKFIPKFFWSNQIQSYSISALEVFKFICKNPQLQQMKIKGVKIIKLQQSLELLNPKNSSQTMIKRQFSEPWMELFTNAPRLSLTLDTKYQLYPYTNQQFGFYSYYRPENIMFFINNFCQISDEKVALNFFVSDHCQYI